MGIPMHQTLIGGETNGSRLLIFVNFFAALRHPPQSSIKSMYSIIQDSVDTSISIVRDDSTGFYNVTKTANQFYEMNESKPRKLIADWLRLVQTKALFEATKEVYNLGEVMIQRISDTRDEHKGTYVHHALYRSFLMWLNPKYAIKIFAIIDEHQRVFEEKLKNRNRSLEEMNNAMHAKLDALINGNKQLLEKNNQLLDHAEDLKYDLESTKTSLTTKLDTVVGMLEAKSRVSTMNPRNPNMIHHFLVMGHSFIDESNRNGKRLSFIAGQDTRIRSAKRQKLEDNEHQWVVEIEKHYNANPIDLRNNIADAVNSFIRRRIEEINASSTVQITREDIPITCKKLSATYVDNEYVSFEELKEVIDSVNFNTQRSPYTE